MLMLTQLVVVVDYHMIRVLRLEWSADHVLLRRLLADLRPPLPADDICDQSYAGVAARFLLLVGHSASDASPERSKVLLCGINVQPHRPSRRRTVDGTSGCCCAYGVDVVVLQRNTA